MYIYICVCVCVFDKCLIEWKKHDVKLKIWLRFIF